MKKSKADPKRPIKLRKRTEELLNKNPAVIKKIPSRDLRDLLEDLQIYQIELEKYNNELQKVHKDLRESEEKFRTIFAYSTDGIIVADSETKKFIYVNPAICKALDYTEEELTQMSVVDIHPKNSLEHVVSEFEAQSRGEKLLAMNNPFLKKDGTIIYMDTNTSLVKMGEKPRIICVFRDITDRKQAEKALMASEERYRSLAENSMVGFWQITLEGYTTYINPAMCSMIEIESPEELSGQTYYSFFTSESLEMIDHERAKRPEGRGSCYEVEIVGKRGGRRNVVICGASLLSAEGKSHGYIATFTDITDRKRAETKLRKAHDELEYRVKERTRDLEIKTKSLEETNTALEVLLHKREKDKTELEDNVLTNVKELVEPYIRKIKKTKLDNQQKTFLSIMEFNFKEIISPFTRKMYLKYFNLTPTEIRIANLIRHGSSTKKIAELINRSPRTVQTHRRNIRKKIGLDKKKANLRSHLLSLY